MRVINKAIELLSSPKARFVFLANRGFYDHMEDRKYLELEYRMITGKELNLDNPQSFDDKLQWLKLYDHDPFYSSIVDKYEAKKYIAGKVGDCYVPKLLGVWDGYDEIDFDALPPSFVLKCTHDSGGVVICRDKAHFDFNKAKRTIDKSMRRDFYLQNREWPYKNVKHRIIAEELLSDGSEEDGLTDYKFLCFNGEPKVMYIKKGMSDDSPEDFFDMDFNHLSLQMVGCPNALVCSEKPRSFEAMKELARTLSKDFLHIRVDFFEINGRPYVGELTFFQDGGMTFTTPHEWDERLASWIDLSGVEKRLRCNPS